MKAPHGCNAREREYHLLDVPDHINAIGYTPDGWLNEYSLMCGYQELLEMKRMTFRLWYESGHYQVFVFDEVSRKRTWESFDNVDEARNRYAVFVEGISSGIV